MALKKKEAPAGAPEWVLTYGDMMSLLLCFFILLAAFADYEKGGPSERTVVALASIQEALGMEVKGKAFRNAVEFNSLIQHLKEAIRDFQTRARGNASEEGLRGKHFRLRRIRDGMEIMVGGPILFEPFSSEITPSGAEALTQIAGVLKGHRNMVEIRGHAGESAEASDWTYADAMKLSYARAEQVAKHLVATGLDPRTLRLIAVGDNEPAPRGEGGLTNRDDNRRVEIIVRESLLDDYR